MELLLDQTFAFTLADVRKNILVPFRVDRDFDHLAICLHYGPKAIRDPEIIMPQIRKCVKTYFPAGYQLTEADMQEYQELFNFVTLSLDKNGEYVDFDINEALAMEKGISEYQYEVAKSLSANYSK